MEEQTDTTVKPIAPIEPKSAAVVSRGRAPAHRRMSSRSRSSELMKVVKVPEQLL